MVRSSAATHAATLAASVPGRAGAEHAPCPGRPHVAPATRRWRSAELFGAGLEVEIEHGPAVYRLRLTALGKLILTK